MVMGMRWQFVVAMSTAQVKYIEIHGLFTRAGGELVKLETGQTELSFSSTCM